jgi:hypothetical protein
MSECIPSQRKAAKSMSAPHALPRRLRGGRNNKPIPHAMFRRWMPASLVQRLETPSSSAKTLGILHPQSTERGSTSCLRRNRPICCRHGMNQLEVDVRTKSSPALAPAAVLPQSQPRHRARRVSLQLWRGLTACIMQCRSSRN